MLMLNGQREWLFTPPKIDQRRGEDVRGGCQDAAGTVTRKGTVRIVSPPLN